MELKLILEPSLGDRLDAAVRSAALEELKNLRAAIGQSDVTIISFTPRAGSVLNFSELDVWGRFAVVVVEKATPVLTALLGTWLHARYGRKVRLKVGELEAEAQTAEEVEKLIDKAQEIQQRNEPKKIHES